MYTLSNNSYVTLKSNASKDLFSDNTPYNFTNQLCTTLNFSNKTKVALSEIHLPLNFRGDLEQAKIKQIFILSDLVDDSIIGSSRSNILKVINVNTIKFPNSSQVILFENLFFYPLVRNSINNIKIIITDSFGNILKPGTRVELTKFDETFIVLHFK